jgi:hypothetical protein
MIIIDIGQDHIPRGYSYAKKRSYIASNSLTNQDHHMFHDVLQAKRRRFFSNFANIRAHKIAPLS